MSMNNPNVIIKPKQPLLIKTLAKRTKTAQNAVIKAITNDKTIEVQKNNIISSQGTKNDVKQILIRKGLDVNYIVDKYKDIMEQPAERPKTSDQIKVLENLSKLHNLQVESENINPIIQEKIQNNQINNYIVEINEKTAKYIKKLQEKNNK